MYTIGSDISYAMLVLVALMAVFIVALILATVGVKSARYTRNRLQNSRRRRIEPHLERFLLEGDSSGLHALSMKDRDQHLAPLMVERMHVLRGAERLRMAGLAGDLGLLVKYRSDLSSRGRWRRARAVERLGYFGGPDEASAIAALLEDEREDETVRAVAARSLARIGSEAAVEALVRTLDNPSELTRLRVAENLDRVGQPAVPPLVALLEEAPDPERARAPYGPIFASRILGGLRAQEARPALRTAARDGNNPDIRAQAAKALGSIGDTEDVPLLVEAAKDEQWPVRVQAANALGAIGDPTTIPKLEALIADREWWVRTASAGALVNMGRSGEDALVRLLGSPDPYARDRAAATLEKRGITRRFVRQLALESRRGERARAAVSALAGSGVTRHLYDLLREMPDGEEKHILLGLTQAEPVQAKLVAEAE
jgi:HEAT repeat protein